MTQRSNHWYAEAPTPIIQGSGCKYDTSDNDKNNMVGDDRRHALTPYRAVSEAPTPAMEEGAIRTAEHTDTRQANSYKYP